MRERLAKCLTLALLLASLPVALRGDQHPNQARGFRADQSFQLGDLDHVNLFNGNLSITIPLGQAYPVGGGLAYGLTLTYGGNVWDVQERVDAGITYTRLIPGRDYNAGLGWILSLGKLLSPSAVANNTQSWVYVSPDGAEHRFYTTLHPGELPTTGVFYTRDGSYLRLRTPQAPDTPAQPEVEFPDGRIQVFEAVSPIEHRLAQIKDRFTNVVTITYPGTSWVISDSHRTHTVSFKPGLPGPVVDRVRLAAFGAPAEAEYVFGHTSPQISRPCGSTDTDPSFDRNKETVTLLTSVQLPDGSLYNLPVSDYWTGDGVNCDGQKLSGHIRGMTLPTQGRLEWDYRDYAFPTESDRRSWLQRSTGVAKRRLRSASGVGEWVYTPELRPLVSTPSNPKREQVVTLTTPLGRSVHFFSAYAGGGTGFSNTDRWDADEYGLPFTREGAGSSPGPFLSNQVFKAGDANPVRSTSVRYERDHPDGGVDSNRRLAARRTVYHDDGGTFAEETWSDFDGLGHYRTHDTAGNFPGSNVRRTHVFYNPDQKTYGQPDYRPKRTDEKWLLNFFPYEWTNADGRTEFRSTCYEPETGFYSCRRVHNSNGSGQTSQDLITWFDKDARGNVTAESFYGGDTQAVTVGNVLPLPTSPVYRLHHTYSGGVRATSQYANTSFKVLDLTIDANTGLPSISRDPARYAEVYGYDTSGRLTSVEPGDRGVGADALTTYTYCTATSNPGCGGKAEVIVARKTSVTGAEITATRLRFDDLGRLNSQEERLPPSGAYQARTFAYDGMGWRTFVSEQGAAGGTSYLGYDPFGRPATIRPADGAAHDISLSYLGVRQVQRTVRVATSESGAETPATTTELYDRHGRLYEVTEPNGVKTRYEYDVADRLRKVCQNATGAGTESCGQARHFTYDHRGFLLSEQHPEKGGPSGNGVVSYLDYDARGHALRRIDGTNDLTFGFDKAERRILVRETSGAQRPLKSFTYGVGTGTSDASSGKIKTATRYNYVAAPFNATVEVQDTYVYGGRGGRVSQHDTQMIYNGALAEGFRQSPTWDNLGNLASQSYPDCVAGSCAALDAPRSVSFTYNHGRLATVPGFTGTAVATNGASVSQITYHPNGMVHQVPHANGMLSTVGKEPSGMARPESFQASKGATIYWRTGPHSYDGAGNLEGTWEFTYAYDPLSRVVQSTMGGAGTTQDYTYDVYGNIQSVTTSGSTVATPTSSTTNRLTSGSYDAAGNLLAWAGNLYEYDAFHQLKRYVAGAEDWRYIYTADDERFWSYRVGSTAPPVPYRSIWALRGLDGQVLRRYDAHLGWGNYEDYVYREGQLLAAAHTPAAPAPKTGMWHFHLDHLGTPRMVTNQNGASIGFHRYYPFGQEQTELQEGETRKFTGHERDLANLTGTADDLDYMHARHYSPLTARFLSFDPIGGAFRAPQSWNRYSYVMGRPLVYTDPEGLFVSYGIAQQMALAWANAFTFSDTITVTGQGDPLGYNPLTGVTGLNLLTFGSGFLNSLTSLGGSVGRELTLYAGAYYSALGQTGQTIAAFHDGANPGGDPFAMFGAYELEEEGVAHFSGEVAGTAASLFTAGAGYRVGVEIRVGGNIRIAPFGNRTGHRLGRYPHYHRRGRLGPNGKPLAGRGLNRHRPWEPPAYGQPWWSRF